MNGLRVALVTRRFWPHVGGAEMVMSNLAVEFQRLGSHPTIVTAQWESDWPVEFVHREVQVVRLRHPKARMWGTYRYMKALSRWLRNRREQLDAVCVSMLKHDAYAALVALEDHPVPVIIRAEGAGETGDCAFHRQARFGGRIKRRCQTADAVVAPSQAIETELLEAGFERPMVHFVANGVAMVEERSDDSKNSARAALADANSDLNVYQGSPVVVYTGRLHAAKGLYELVKAFRPVVNKWPNAKLWLIGEGPDRDELYGSIVDHELHHQVLLPGAFDFIDEVLQAADLFVLPSYQEGMSLSLLEAMAAGTPVVATDIPGNRTLVDPDVHGLLVPPRNVQALGEAMIAMLDNPAQAADMAASARQRVRDHFSLTKMANEHLSLFAQLKEEKKRFMKS